MKAILPIFGLILFSCVLTTLAKPQNGFFPEDEIETSSTSGTTPTTLTFPDSPTPKSLDPESEKTIDAIVTATREGRQLNFTDSRFNQILSDPSVKDKLASASEVEARGFVHDKLCSIGLCDNNYNPYGNHHGHGLGSHIQLVQPVAVKPVGSPIPAIPLEPIKHNPAYGPPVGRPIPPFGNPPSSPYGHYKPIPKPGGPQIFPAHGPVPPFLKPGYGPPGPIIPPPKSLNTHVHHHVHHHNQPGAPLLPYEDGYYDSAKKSLSIATPGGKDLGSYTQAQTLNPSYSSKNCVCMPAEQCYHDAAGTQQSQVIQGNGIPNNGFVGYGIDPRNLKAGYDVESNSTEDTDFETTTVPESTEASRKRRDLSGIEGGILKPDGESEPRQLNYGGSCQPGFICCQQNLVPSATNNFIDNNSGRFSQTQQVYGQCGKRQNDGINGRVISGGNAGSSLSINGETSFGDYPWHVAILKKDGFVCSGSLIDSYNVLTAAHCLKRLTPSDLRIRLGEWDVNHETEYYPHVEIKVDSFIIHPEYYAGNLVNDIAILRLSSGIDFPRHPHISPICMPPPNLDFTGRRCMVAGWGKDAFGNHGQFQNLLKEVDLPVLSNFDCEQKLKRTKLGYDFTLDKGFMCAGGEPLKDACKGDGGGGLVCDVHGTWYLAGVVSWGVECGLENVPGVYAKVSQYTNWIQQTTGILH